MDTEEPISQDDLDALDGLLQAEEGEEETTDEDGGSMLGGMGDYHLKSALRGFDDMMRHPIFRKEFEKAIVSFNISHNNMLSQIETMFFMMNDTPIIPRRGMLLGDFQQRVVALPHGEDVFDIIHAEICVLHPHLQLSLSVSAVRDIVRLVMEKVAKDDFASMTWAAAIMIKNFIPAWKKRGKQLLDWPSVNFDAETGYVRMVLEGDLIIYMGSDICIIEKYPNVRWAPVSYILNGADKLAERYNVRLYSGICDHLSIPDRVSLDDLNRIIDVGDRCLDELGNEGYAVIASYEALLAGIIQMRDDDKLIADVGLLRRTTLEEFANTRGGKYLAEWDRMFLNMSAEQVACAHGLYRIWGLPVVDILGGILKMKEVASVKKCPDESVLKDIGRQFKEMFFTAYHRLHKHYPKSDILPGFPKKSYIIEALQNNTSINVKVVGYVFLDWDYVELKQNFEVPYSWNLVHNLKDKAISPTRKEIYHTLVRRNTIFGAENRRGILKSLKMETVQLREFLQSVNDDGLPDEDRIIGVYPKERELKIKARLFSLMSFKLRLYIVSTEALLGDKILKYFPQITMSLDMLTMIKKMFRVSSQTTRGDDSVTVIFNLDFVKWNLQMRKNICHPVFRQLGELFGMKDLYDRTHDLFRTSTIYLCSGEGELTADPEYGVNPNGIWAWTGDESGKEGLRQKGWTILTVVAIMLIAKRHNVDVSLMGGGDNQVLGITISGMVRDSMNGLTDESKGVASKIIKSFTDDLLTTFQDLGLPLKASETWVSDSLFMYNKHMFYKGIPLRSPLKAVSRIFPLANDSIMTLDNMINNISSGVKAACMKERNGIPLIFLKALSYRRAAEIVLTLHPLVTCFRAPSLPTQGIVMRSSKKTNVKVTSKQLRNYFACCLTGASIMGTPGTIHVTDMIMRGFPDPLTGHLAFIGALATRIQSVHLRAAVEKMSHMSINRSIEYAKLVEDPASINHDAPTHGLNELRQMSRDFLMKTTLATNPYLTDLFSLLDRKSESAFYEQLCSAEELDVKVLHEIAGATLYGYTNGIASRIDQTRTVRALNENEDVMKRMADAEWRYVGYLLARDILTHDLVPDECSRVSADRYRLYSWRKPVIGVTVPHPIEMCSVTSQTRTSYMDAVICWSDNVQGNDIYTTMGLGKIYQGSYTKERFKATDIAAAYGNEDILSKAVRIQKLINWRYDETSNFADIIRLTLKAITDADTEGFHRSKEEIKGEFDHRRGISGDISGGIPNFLVTPTSHFSSTTSSWTSHSRGGKNENIHFQSVLINLLYRAMVFRGSSLSTSPVVWYSEERCPHCIVEIREPDPSRTTPKLDKIPTAPGNPFAFIESINVKLDYHHIVEIHKGNEEENLINSSWDGTNISCNQEAGLLLFLMVIGSRQISESFILLMRERVQASEVLQMVINRITLMRRMGLDKQFPVRSTSCLNLLLGTDQNLSRCHDRFGVEIVSGSWEKGIQLDASFIYRDDLATTGDLHVNVYLQNVPLQLALSHAASRVEVQRCLECCAIISDRVSKRDSPNHLHWRCPEHMDKDFSPTIVRIHSEKLIKGENIIDGHEFSIPFIDEPVALEVADRTEADLNEWSMPIYMYSAWENILPQLYVTMKSAILYTKVTSIIVEDEITLINLVARCLNDLRRSMSIYVLSDEFSGTEINNKYDNMRLLPPGIRDTIRLYEESKHEVCKETALVVNPSSKAPIEGGSLHVIWADNWTQVRETTGHMYHTSVRIASGYCGILEVFDRETPALFSLAGSVLSWEKKPIDHERAKIQETPIQLSRVLGCSRLGVRGMRWVMWDSALGLERIIRTLRSKLLSLSSNPGRADHWKRACQKILKTFMISLYAHVQGDMLERAGSLVGVRVHGALSGITAVHDAASENRLQRRQYIYIKENSKEGPFILRNRVERRISLMSAVYDLLG
ncbi:polymerase [maize Iranian mosaic virus]|uniref:RNA-directed RNA polymerase n=1 Tax=maize Iranian mosaic virus TaxID=348823 RepID=B5FX46_9RHAB|nr:polymerase [maize Iranian mosaic virus]